MRRALIRGFRHPNCRLFEPFQGGAAINIRASFNDRHPCPGPGKLVSNQRTGNTSAHNQDVALVAQSTLKAQKPSFQGLYCRCSVVAPTPQLAHQSRFEAKFERYWPEDQQIQWRLGTIGGI
jgi:hypothetical protein